MTLKNNFFVERLEIVNYLFHFNFRYLMIRPSWVKVIFRNLYGTIFSISLYSCVWCRTTNGHSFTIHMHPTEGFFSNRYIKMSHRFQKSTRSICYYLLRLCKYKNLLPLEKGKNAISPVVKLFQWLYPKSTYVITGFLPQYIYSHLFCYLNIM